MTLIMLFLLLVVGGKVHSKSECLLISFTHMILIMMGNDIFLVGFCYLFIKKGLVLFEFPGHVGNACSVCILFLISFLCDFYAWVLVDLSFMGIHFSMPLMTFMHICFNMSQCLSVQV